MNRCCDGRRLHNLQDLERVSWWTACGEDGQLFFIFSEKYKCVGLARTSISPSYIGASDAFHSVTGRSVFSTSFGCFFNLHFCFPQFFPPLFIPPVWFSSTIPQVSRLIRPALSVRLLVQATTTIIMQAVPKRKKKRVSINIIICNSLSQHNHSFFKYSTVPNSFKYVKCVRLREMSGRWRTVVNFLAEPTAYQFLIWILASVTFSRTDKCIVSLNRVNRT